MSVTIADKLIEAAQNEQRIYKKGYDLGYEEGYSECEAECPKAVERSFIARTNGNYKFTPADREVFSLVKLTVAVPSDVKEEEEGVFEVLENGEYDFLPSADKVFSSVKVTVDVPSGEIEGKTNVTNEFSISVYPGDASMGTLSYSYCPPTSEGGTTFSMMDINSFGFVAASRYDGLVPGDVYDVYCVPVGELWETVLFANNDYQTLAIPSSNANIRKYARYYENEGRLRVTIPPDFSGLLFINVKWLEGGCAIYKVDESEGGGTDDGSYDEGYNDGYTDGFEDGKAEGGGSQGFDPLYYANTLYGLFNGASFPDNTNLVLRLQKPPIASDGNAMYQTFSKANGLKSVKIITDDKDTAWELHQTFRENTALETIDLTECSRKITKIDYLIYNSTGVKSILGALDVSQCTTFNYSFFASQLRDVEFVPNTIKAAIRFNSGYLTQASVESIINGLADLTSGTAQTLTLNGWGSKLTDDQKARITAKNWTLAY